ncbi:MAG TPA: amidohydrolase family protein [Chthoniobacterales bacterium]|nr:amidohydrolase family protein [Chthoniobacterales bacterium]
MIIRARTVVSFRCPPIDDGAVVVEGSKIAAVGDFHDLKRDYGGVALDLGEQVLLPGLINAHCHLDYTMMRGRIPPPRSFADWIRAINAEKANFAAEDYVRSIKDGFAEAARFGTTTIANLTAFPDLASAIEEPVRTWWFGELIDVRDPDSAEKMAVAAAASLKSKKLWGLAPHAPFTASPRLYKRCQEIAREENAILTTHLAESAEEMQMSAHRTGPLAGFLDSLGVDLFEANGITPVQHMLQMCPLSDRWILAHLNSVHVGDIKALAELETKPHVAHCPRSHTYFGHEPFELELFRDSNFNICLGTDSLASNPDLSLLAEMRELIRKHPSVPPSEALEMVTVNGAQALGQAGLLGCLAEGAWGDMIALPVSGSDLFEGILEFEGAVPWIMRSGQITEDVGANYRT